MTTKNMFNLDGKRALVTGGSRGIGRAIAVGLRESGAQVVSVARTDTGDFDGVRHIAADVSEVGKIPDLVDEVEKNLGGPIDLVVHAAGVQHRCPATDFPPEQWQRILNINLTAPYVLSQEIGKRQLDSKRGGAHLFVASLTSELGFPNISAYAASKSGVMGIVRSFSKEWASRGIRVNGIGPGYIRTALTEDLLSNPVEAERLFSRIPMERFGVPEDLVGPAIFLLSNASEYVSGQLVYVDGGWTAA